MAGITPWGRFRPALSPEGAAGPFTWRSCWSGSAPPPPAVVLQWESGWMVCPGSGGTGILTHPWHLTFLSEGLEESLPACSAHRKRVRQGTKTGGPRAWEKSVVVASGQAPPEAGGSALEGAGKSSPFSGQQRAPWQSPGTRTDTDMPPLA